VGLLPKEGGDCQLEHQKDAGDSPMEVDRQLCTAPLEPLPDQRGGTAIMSDEELLELLELMREV
jgi:hypothetical protein